MHPQLQVIANGFHSATARLNALARSVPAERWSVRHDPNKWSVAECVAHLNLTGAAYADILKEAIARASRPESRGPKPEQYRRDFWGWLLWKMMPPPVRFPTKTIARFIPESTAPADALVTEFDRWQGIQIDLLAAADGLPLNSIRVVSPFNAKISYNLYSCFSILPAHQHRHLWQAEQVWHST